MSVTHGSNRPRRRVKITGRENVAGNEAGIGGAVRKRRFETAGVTKARA